MTAVRPGTDPNSGYQPNCGDRESNDGRLCSKCLGLVSAAAAVPTASDPEPDYRRKEITQPATCSGCGQRFRPSTGYDDTGEYARVYKDASGRWRRYHEACWPWSRKPA